ncbi:MAG: hypothetical protein RIE32_01375 [Phycisphaerales bacterium]
MGLVLIIGGLVAAALGIFAWPAMEKLPTHRVRSALFGSKAARALLVGGGLVAAGAGVLVLFVSDG